MVFSVIFMASSPIILPIFEEYNFPIVNHLSELFEGHFDSTNSHIQIYICHIGPIFYLKLLCLYMFTNSNSHSYLQGISRNPWSYYVACDVCWWISPHYYRLIFEFQVIIFSPFISCLPIFADIIAYIKHFSI